MRCQKPRLSFPDLILFPDYMENQLTDLFPDDVKLQNLKRHRHYFEAQIKTGTQMFPYQKYLPKTAFLEILENSENRPISSTHCPRSEEHTSELQSRGHLVCRLLLEIKNNISAGAHTAIRRHIALPDSATHSPLLVLSALNTIRPPPRVTLFPYTTLFRSDITLRPK